MAKDVLIASDRTDDRILLALKSRGALSTGALAKLMQISVPGVRQQLRRLDEMGLVTSQAQREGVGRPARYWQLTPAATGRFPDTHAELTREMIVAIRDGLGEAALATVIAQCQRQMEQRYVAALGTTQRIRIRLDRLAAARSADGYMAEVEAVEGGWILAENHCPICAAAETCQGFCDGELALFRRLLKGATVQRTEHLVAGGRRCAYRVTKQS